MKITLLALIFLLTLAPLACAQKSLPPPAQTGGVRVGVVLWDVKQFSLRHYVAEPPPAPNILGPLVTTFDRQWGRVEVSRSGADDEAELRFALKAYPHYNPDGAFTVIVDLTVTENGGPNGPVTHRLWNIVATGKNGVGEAPPNDVMFPAAILGGTLGYAYIGQMRLEDGTERDAMVFVTVLPPGKG